MVIYSSCSYSIRSPRDLKIIFVNLLVALPLCIEIASLFEGVADAAMLLFNGAGSYPNGCTAKNANPNTALALYPRQKGSGRGTPNTKVQAEPLGEAEPLHEAEPIDESDRGW